MAQSREPQKLCCFATAQSLKGSTCLEVSKEPEEEALPKAHGSATEMSSQETPKRGTFLRGCPKEPSQSVIVKGLVPSAVIVESWSAERSLRNLATFWVTDSSSLKNQPPWPIWKCMRKSFHLDNLNQSCSRQDLSHILLRQVIFPNYSCWSE